MLNLAIWSQTGLVTFNGPSLMTDWAEFPDMPAFSERQALNAICRAEPMGDLAPSPWWTEEFLDWSTGADLVRPRARSDSSGWQWLCEGNARGQVLGGCIESLQHLRGTRYWPDLDGAILFLETSELRPTPEDVDGLLMDYENMGVLDQINGLVFARPYGYASDDIARLYEIVRNRTERFGFPILANTDTGHTSPLQTLPIGVEAVLDSSANRLAIVEAAVN